VRIAQMLGKKTMFIAQGVGPLNLPRSRKLVAGIANRLDAITVRDPESLDLLKAIGVTRPPMEVTADPALLLPDVKTTSTKPDIDRMAVSLRPWHAGTENITERLVQSGAALSPRPKMSILAMQPQQDVPVMHAFDKAWDPLAVCETQTIAPDHNNRLQHIIEGLSRADLVVAMRLHALILAAGAGVPSLALSYDPKVMSFMRFSGQEDAVVDIASTDNLPQLLADIWNHRKARAERLRERLPGMRAAAMRNAEVACGLLGS
jgi:polysaccharide pyruvyl transferase CsaB